ncbi:hypothetical protein D9758_003737 [Tetrapyrgos nigripes]|uniref:Sodium/calcium exchanger membrane region domain-containing protein n=1 Tax=Tetrapyrgos nigripes TaxID=182062 RepID=A0A8H5GLP4_9AGAR|nr:hypothetical protein D9758_003737 [Tetrapyrgos nigripes]
MYQPNQPPQPGEALARFDSNLSAMTNDSRTYLVNHPGISSREKHLPLYHKPRHAHGSPHDGSGSRAHSWMKLSWEELLKGWRLLLLGSWLNILLLVVPVAVRLGYRVRAICLIALIPLVKMHEVSTHELAIRIGGSKAGLVNASLSNTVEIVVAFSALRKCELEVVQSSLIGSILGKLLLILGLCFFAGGLRFSEQGFDATASQIHSSLLSISVTALLLPAAYHFAVSGDSDVMTPRQRDGIMDMSHGVSIILMFIYLSYLLFQLVSHTHLYQDLQDKSRRLSLKVAPIFHLDKGKTLTPSPSCQSDGSDRENISKWSTDVRSAISPSSSNEYLSRSPSLSPRGRNRALVPGTAYISQDQPGFSTASEITLAEPVGVYPPPGGATVRLVDVRGGRSFSGSTINSQHPPDLIEIPLDSQSKAPLHYPSPASSEGSEPKVQGPQLSIFLTVMSLAFVTIAVAFTADWLVEAMNGISSTISKQWIAFILLPAVSSIAECGNAIGGSVKDQLTFSISVAVGASIQTALFVIPLMVTLAWSMGKPLALLFDPFESLVLYMSVQTMTHVMGDGKSNYMEGLILICLYIIIAVSFWFYPGSSLPASLGAACSTSP